MDLNEKISLVKEISGLIYDNISDIWPGLHTVPFILYDDKNQVAAGEKWPEQYVQGQDGIWVAHGLDPLLMGNTAMVYYGVRVAVWDTRTWSGIPDPSLAAAGITHEMFHAFQEESLNLPWANELLMPGYPHNPRSVALVIEENKWLAQMLSCSDTASVSECLSNIIALRRLREAEIGAEYMEYDRRCESIEGTAAYVEVRMKAAIQGKAISKHTASYLPILTDRGRLLKNYRHRCYAAGLAFCLAADVMWPEWKAEWPVSGKTFFDWIQGKVAYVPPEAVGDFYINAAEELIAAYENEKQNKINGFLAQPLDSLEGPVQITGFDPMNLTCSGGRCLHLHGRVSFGGNEQLLEMPFLAEYGDNILDVKRILIPSTAQDCGD